MQGSTDLPIALRRPRRSSAGLQLNTTAATTTKRDHSPPEPSYLPTPTDSNASTPRKRGRPRKKVRFSDPGPAGDHSLPDESPLSTGLTPMVRRTSLAAPRRRHSTPGRPSGASAGSGRSPGPSLACFSSPFSGEVTFVPLRQVLDGRVKRRIRRNGLSEEMNSIHAEKKRRVAELQRLRDELNFKDAEILQLRQTQQRLKEQQRQQQQQHTPDLDPDETIDTVVGDTERIFELEHEVAGLRRQLSQQISGAVGGADATEHSEHHDWTMAARDPFSKEDYSMMDVGSFLPDRDDDEDDDMFGDVTMADLHCSTPSRSSRKTARETGAGSFPTPPATSPLAMAPITPSSLRFSTPRSHTAVQAALPDPEKQELEDELSSLQLEVAKITTTLKAYQSLASRVSARMSSFTPTTTAMTDEEAIAAAAAANPSSPEPALEARLTALLTTVSDRAAALGSLSSSLSDLGFPGSDAGEIVTSLKAAFRAARLELEYLTPGEVALPLTSAGAAVLDLLLVRLRDFAKRAREDESTIDEYHAQELSLRQQLGARVDTARLLDKEVSSLRGDLAARDATVAELQIGLDRLKGAAASYARDVSELEKLVERLETKRLAALDECELRLQDSESTHQGELEEAAAAKDAAVAALEAKLAAALAEAGELRVSLAGASADAAMAAKTHEDATRSLNGSHGKQLALRDARVAELKGEVERVNGALRAAHDTIARLRADAERLKGRLRDEKDAAKTAVDAMRAELERVVAMGHEFLAATPTKGKDASANKKAGSSSSAQKAGGSATKGGNEGMPVSVIRPGGLFDAGRTRRRSGSGAGMVDEMAVSPVSASKSKKRRRYDSGLGFLDEEDVDI